MARDGNLRIPSNGDFRNPPGREREMADYTDVETPIDDNPYNGNELDKSRNVNLGFGSNVSQRYFTGTQATLGLTTLQASSRSDPLPTQKKVR